MSKYSIRKKTVIGHFRKSSAFLLNFIFNHQFVFCAIGWINRRFNFLTSVFVVYPASKEYALSYVYEKHLHLLRWRPWLVGVFKQNGKWGVMLGISSTEDDFYHPDNESELREMVDRVAKIQYCLSASQKTFSGILPGVLYKKKIIQDAPEADVTVKVVTEAERKIRKIARMNDTVPLIILGGEGFIGRRLIPEFNGREIYIVDLADNVNGTKSWPDHLRGQQVILLNVSRRAVLSDYVSRIWPEIVLLNEVYPEPGGACLQQLIKLSVSVYHVVGVDGVAYPPFPRAYQGGIPACAARLTPDMNVLVKKLV